MANHNQFIAPNGFATLVKGELYHLLRSDPILHRVVLVAFTPDQRTKLLILTREEFEDSLDSKICRTTDVTTVPPWLVVHGSITVLENVMRDASMAAAGDELAHDGDDREATTNGANIAELRLLHIQNAVDHTSEVLSARDPNAELNKYARACRPAQNETRFRTWFYAYLAFGHNVAVLYPAFHNRGKYDRGDPMYQRPFGAPGAKGADSRSKMVTPEQIEKMLAAFDKVSKLNKKRDGIYDEVLRGFYGCRVTEIDGRAHYYHPTGEHFPTYHQFWYCCEKNRGGRVGIKRLTRGEETVRNQDTPSRGQYSMGSANIMERVHLDVEHTQERPLAYQGIETKPRLSICIVRDALTGFGLGIGVGNGIEDAQIYLEALFCMAIPKSLFGRLIGYRIQDEEWDSEGLPTWAITDRGPGGRQVVLDRIQKMGVAKTTTPTQTPQSNSPAEARNSRQPTIAGIPVEEVGTLTTIGLAKKAVANLILENRSSSARDRASNSQIMRGEVTPQAIHMDMQRRGRSDARFVPVEDAVRMFLEPIEVTYRDGLLYVHGRPFGGAAWQECLEQYPRGLPTGELIGYALTLSTRHIWVEVGHKLVMVDALTRYRDGDEELYLSLYELEEIGRAAAKAETARRNQRPAEIGLAEAKFKERTGMSMSTKTVRRARLTNVSNAENEILKA